MGDGEIMPNLRLAPGEHYIAVREVWTAGRPATENVSDWYTLTATWKPVEAGHESEPDDVASAALPLTASARPCAACSGGSTTSTTITCAGDGRRACAAR